MSKKRKKVPPVQPSKPKGNVVWRQSAEEATMAPMVRRSTAEREPSRLGSDRCDKKEPLGAPSLFPALALVAAAAPSTAAEKMGRVCGGSGTRSRLGL